jgi:putative nucleotidyltransferase with HDIG domain
MTTAAPVTRSPVSQRLTLAVDSLPTLPVVALQIGEVIHSRNASVHQVAEILRGDPATSAKLLKLVNSPYFGIPGGVSDVARAIPFVGFNTLYQLVLTISVLETLDAGHGAIDARGLWQHALSVATAARELATDVRCPDGGACFTAGLLHDMGKIALAKLEPQRFAKAMEAARVDGISTAEAEKRFDLPAHDMLGSWLAKQWRFPATLATPIEHHHSIHRVDVRERLPPNLRAIAEIVSVADSIAERCAEPFGATAGSVAHDAGTDEAATTAHAEILDRNGLSAAKLDALCDRTKKELERSKVFLSLLK